MKAKNFIFLFIFVILSVSVLGISPILQQSSGSNELQIINPKNDFFKQYENISLHFHIYNSSGSILLNTQTSCMIHIYDQNNNHLFETSLGNDANNFDKDVDLNSSFTSVDKGYPYVVWCNSSQGQSGFLSSNYEVTYSGYDNSSSGSGILVILALIPLLFGLILLVGSVALSDEHSVLKIFMFLLSPLMTFISFHFATISLIKYYGMQDLQNSVGDAVYWFAILMFVIILYFIIYFIYKAINYVAKQKEEKLKY